jgi:NodT family efflux transporter outer membrane factor (OMF) lipoprotein
MRMLSCAILVVLTQGLAGCTSFSEYVHNGFKVGPNYCPPEPPVAERWIDEGDKRVRTDDGQIDQWWTVFGDPVLNHLIQYAYQQNLTLREAGFRILQARAQRGIAVGELFPQQQYNSGGYNRIGVSETVANRISTPLRWFDQWEYGFGLGWELDFWGRFRRAIEAADAELDASVANYDDVLVTLLADVGRNYVELRTLQKRLELAKASEQLFAETLKIPQARFEADAKNRVPYDLARANLAQSQALIPRLEIAIRQAENRLCILLGTPPRDIEQELGQAPIPTPSEEVAIGIPADLLRRRPDIRRAEREAAAQCAQIGIAESDFYPIVSINGTIGWSAKELSDLFARRSFRGSVGPGFQWNILHYGRIRNHVSFEDARFQELATRYQNIVLKADGEVENALIAFIKSHDRAKALEASAEAWRDGAHILVAQYRGELIDFVPVGYFEQNLLLQQDEAAQARGDVSLALVEVYRALGGGWQIRMETGDAPATAEVAPQPAPADPITPAEVIPAPKP